MLPSLGNQEVNQVQGENPKVEVRVDMASQHRTRMASEQTMTSGNLHAFSA